LGKSRREEKSFKIVCFPLRIRRIWGKICPNSAKWRVENGADSPLGQHFGKHYAKKKDVMYRVVAFVRARRVVFNSFLLGVWITTIPLPVFATGSVTLAWNPSGDSAVVGYNMY